MSGFHLGWMQVICVGSLGATTFHYLKLVHLILRRFRVSMELPLQYWRVADRSGNIIYVERLPYYIARYQPGGLSETGSF